ncbi:hypothetical protein [[Mycobacterium] burgundiense]|uniref:Antitoxin n=1 Tax=[Mycobacterium] burgundiense TaxID=3064286 RepID=A0ABN9NFQ3_9MYCO|nr:hypothetical protein [Mycolicibacterium sp. MU0053]CAJ1505580.1 hypothetical protein MU0053_002971 [Mycolicibacterium sp. MU0053]
MAHTTVNSLREVAAMIPADQAQMAVAKVLASLGAFESWNADTLDAVAEAVRDFNGVGGLPPIFDQDDDAVEFWKCIS